jgi:hypothetical protein
LRRSGFTDRPPERYRHVRQWPLTYKRNATRSTHQRVRAPLEGMNMKIGDCLVIEKRNGRFDVFKLPPKGERESIRQDIYDGSTAWLIASAKTEAKSHKVYFKHEAEPDSAIRPYGGHSPTSV